MGAKGNLCKANASKTTDDRTLHSKDVGRIFIIHFIVLFVSAMITFYYCRKLKQVSQSRDAEEIWEEMIISNTDEDGNSQGKTTFGLTSNNKILHDMMSS